MLARSFVNRSQSFVTIRKSIVPFFCVPASTSTLLFQSSHGPAPSTRSSFFSSSSTLPPLKEKPKAEDYFQKYEDKIRQKMENPKELVTKIASTLIEELESAEGVESGVGGKQNKSSPHKAVLPENPLDNMGAPKKLSDILNLELVEKMTPEEITQLWNQHQVSQGRISSVLTKATFANLFERSTRYRMFIFPVPREEVEGGGGLEMFFGQWDGIGLRWVFTSLVEYKAKGEEARPYLLLSFHPDLRESKGVVLMSGELDKELLLKAEEDAKFLASILQFYYLTTDENLQLVHTFNVSPSDFDFNRLVQSMTSLFPTKMNH